MREIVFYGRGGHGAVMASELAAIAAYNNKMYSQAFPFFGGERRGAPVKAFARIDEKPILLHSQIYNPDIIVVLDSELMHIAASEISINGLESNGYIIINEKGSHDADDAVKKLGAQTANVYYIDATSIAVRLGLVVAGWPVINTIMLGALAKATNIFSMDDLGKAILGYWPEELAKKNVDAAMQGYQNVKKLG